MNRKQRRAAAKEQRTEAKTESGNGDAKPDPQNPAEELAFRLQKELNDAIGLALPKDVTPETVPHAEIIRQLGILAATFAVQSRVDQYEFLRGMQSYHQGICEALNIECDDADLERPGGPTIVLAGNN